MGIAIRLTNQSVNNLHMFYLHRHLGSSLCISRPHTHGRTAQADTHFGTPMTLVKKRKRPDVEHIDGVLFRPLTVECDTITIRGGFNKKRQECLATRTAMFQCPGEQRPRRFIHVCKNLPWFSKVIGGSITQSRGMTNITILNKIRDGIKNHFLLPAPAADPGAIVIADTPATGAVVTSVNSAASSSGGGVASSSTDTAPSTCEPPVPLICDDDDDPLANIAAVALATAQAAAARKSAKSGKHIIKKVPAEKTRRIVPNTPVKLRFPNAPDCIAGDWGTIEIWAMLRGPACRDLWVELNCLEWLVAWSCDEHSRHGIMRPYKKPPEGLSPNVEEVPGMVRLWSNWCHRWEIEFLELVDGLPEGELNRRRYLAVASITDSSWATFGTAKPFSKATSMEKREAAKNMTVAWGTAIRDGTEAAFITHHELPNWNHIGHTAQADATCNISGDVEVDAGAADACEDEVDDDASAEGKYDEADDTCEHVDENVCADSDDADSADVTAPAATLSGV